MREMNQREKMMFYFAVPVCLLLAHSIFSRNVRLTMDRQVGAMEEAEARLNQVREQINQIPEAKTDVKKVEIQPTEAPAGPVKHETSLFLFREITTPGEFEGLKIVSTDKLTDTSFRVVVRGEFPAMVRWLTFFERQDGRFTVVSATLAPAGEGEPDKVTKELTGAFEVKLKS